MRQGSLISPALFNVFINRVIVELELLDQGCKINHTWAGCLLYADYIILLLFSFQGLQDTFDKCILVCLDLRLKFYCNKFQCILFGPAHKMNLPVMYLDKEVFQWSHSIKYLGTIFVAGLYLKCDVDYISCKLYAASNCIFSITVGLNELLQISLQQAYCLPCPQYCTAALS